MTVSIDQCWAAGLSVGDAMKASGLTQEQVLSAYMGLTAQHPEPDEEPTDCWACSSEGRYICNCH